MTTVLTCVFCQVVDGGWWEGILNDQVGWFPGNHVEEISPGNKLIHIIIIKLLVTVIFVAETSFQGSKEPADTNRDSLQRYYDLVVKDITDSEEIYTSELTVWEFLCIIVISYLG